MLVDLLHFCDTGIHASSSFLLVFAVTVLSAWCIIADGPLLSSSHTKVCPLSLLHVLPATPSSSCRKRRVSRPWPIPGLALT